MDIVYEDNSTIMKDLLSRRTISGRGERGRGDNEVKTLNKKGIHSGHQTPAKLEGRTWQEGLEDGRRKKKGKKRTLRGNESARNKRSTLGL